MDKRNKKGQFQKGNTSWTKIHGHSIESRKKMSEARKGIAPWNKGIPVTEEVKKRISDSLKGHKISLEIRKKISDALKGKNIAQNNPAWKGGKFTNKNGYTFIYQPHHPYAGQEGYVMEHRLVMEKKIKRFLLPNEKIHHIDGNRSNNNIKNLIVFKNNSEHTKFHHIQESF